MHGRDTTQHSKSLEEGSKTLLSGKVVGPQNQNQDNNYNDEAKKKEFIKGKGRHQ